MAAAAARCRRVVAAALYSTEAGAMRHWMEGVGALRSMEAAAALRSTEGVEATTQV